MVVIKRKRYQQTIATLDDGRDLTIRVVDVGQGYVRLGFIGPHRIVREEIYDKPRKVLSHLAGTPIVVGTYQIQRCSLCGEVLSEFDASEQAADACIVGRFYEVDERKLRLLPCDEKYRFDNDSELPTNCCIFRGTK